MHNIMLKFRDRLIIRVCQHVIFFIILFCVFVVCVCYTMCLCMLMFLSLFYGPSCLN